MVSSLIGFMKILRDDARSIGSAFNVRQKRTIIFMKEFFSLTQKSLELKKI
jgi:hypothetical protein